MVHSSRKPSIGHDGSDLPPHSGGGNDRGGRESGDSQPNYERLRNARRALALFLLPVFMLFVSFTVVYVIRRGDSLVNGGPSHGWIPVQLPWSLLLVNTVVLILSSVTVDLARRAITRQAALEPVKSIPGVSLGDEPLSPWLALTTLLGLVFLGGQLLAWRSLGARGFHMEGGTSSSFIYMLTAMHGLHLAGGMLALLLANVAAWRGRSIESRRIIVDVTSWYWHVMTGLWLYILALFAFAAH